MRTHLHSGSRFAPAGRFVVLGARRMTVFARALAVIAVLLLSITAVPAFAQDATQDAASAPQISLVTFGPGETYWERFGHDAILVGDPADPHAVLYNYGIFDFTQKNFFLNFARGYMTYRIAAQPFYRALRYYAEEQRWAYLQQLDLDDAQRREIATFLAWNVRPENAEYRYDYFISNCATRVRDAIDRASGGALSAASKGVATGRTYRFEATRLIGPDWQLALAMDLGMGPRSDAPIDLWQQSFVPMVLKDAADKAVLSSADGATRPLVLHGTWLLRSDAWPELARPPRWTLPLTAVGLAFAALLWLLDRFRRFTAARWGFAFLATVTNIKAALGGLILLAGWTLTEHWGLWANRNMLLLSPLCLLLIPAWIASCRAHWRPRRWQRVVAVVIAAGATLTIPLLVLPGAQQNLPWIGLWLPVQLVLMWAMLRVPARVSAIP